MNGQPIVTLINMCFIISGNGYILIVKRSTNCKENPDKWEIPGRELKIGTVLIGSLEQEIQQETGLCIGRSLHTVYTTHYSVDGSSYIIIFNIADQHGGNISLNPEKYADFVWIPYKSIFKYDLTEAVRKAVVALGKHLKL